MKKIISAILLSFIFFTLTSETFAQSGNDEMTVILLRHAEKDLSAGDEDPDPPLSTEGVRRAERLIEATKKYKPVALFASIYRRTRATLAPLAERTIPGYKTQIFFYDPRRLDELAARILNSNYGTIIVAGHNTTTPALANMLIGENKYKTLGENEYDKIFVIKIKKNGDKPKVVEETVITY